MEKNYTLLAREFWKNRNTPCIIETRNPQVPFPAHSHDFYELVIIQGGSGENFTPENAISLSKGVVFMVPPGQMHGFRNTQNLKLINVLVSPDFVERDVFGMSYVRGFKQLVADGEMDYFLLDDDTLMQVEKRIMGIQAEIDAAQLGYMQMVVTQLTQLFICILRSLDRRSFRKKAFKMNPVFQIKKYIELNYTEKISMNQLVEMSGLSESSILRRFKCDTGFAPFDYQMHIKLLAAMRQLVETSDSITDVALDNGFGDSNYFCRCFKKKFNMSPREYRKSAVGTP